MITLLKNSMDWDKPSKKFWEQGYLVIQDFFNPVLMDELNAIILNHFGLNPQWEHSEAFIEKSATEVIPWFPVREGDHRFEVLEKDVRLQSLTSAILGDGWKNLYCMAMFSKQGTKGQAWHQDCPPENPQNFNLNRLIYTHDIDASTGGETLCMPNSHNRGPIPVGSPHENLENQIAIRPKKGTLILLHGHSWHRVLPVTGPYRISVNCRAIPANTPEDITDIAVYRNMRYRFSTSEVLEERG